MPASRSLIALLIGTVAFFALWMFALKGGSSSSSSSQGVGQYQSAINKAHQAVRTSNSSNAASGSDGTSSPAPSSSAAGTPTASPSTSSASSANSTASLPSTTSHTAKKPAVHLTPKVDKHNPAALARISTVEAALAGHKTVVMLFYNPRGADDRAVKQELSAVPAEGGSVVKLTIPLSESANFTAVTQQVPVNFSPTVVVISPAEHAEAIPGLIDRYVLAQYVANVARPASSRTPSRNAPGKHLRGKHAHSR